MLPLADACASLASALISLCRKCSAQGENKVTISRDIIPTLPSFLLFVVRPSQSRQNVRPATDSSPRQYGFPSLPLSQAVGIEGFCYSSVLYRFCVGGYDSAWWWCCPILARAAAMQARNTYTTMRAFGDCPFER